ncbi:MAG: TolA-binding protein [Phenylobacterium sp.]|jgi:TolA-binding protein
MHSEIYRIAYQLSLNGRKPSVALIRARLSKPTSLPDIIQALQQWKLTPELGKPEPEKVHEPDSKETATTTDSADESIRLDNIEQRLEQLEDKVERILQLLERV